ncbi:MAG TPA: DUF1801 domain-containing protein [Acidimicrobiia bacterium]|nr:DUF1801 domain-containing protein [Acidimicrobiia bacterium]
MARKKPSGLTAAEKAAMKETMEERAREASGKSAGEADLLAKIAEMPKADRDMAKRIHEIVTGAAPDLKPKTWYGMPAYARDGKVVCFFQSAAKFDARYATLGFNDTAKLDQGAMWPTSFALKELNDKVEKKIASLVKKAVR